MLGDGTRVGWSPAPYVVDWNNDGLDDLVAGFNHPSQYGGIGVALRQSDGSLGPFGSVFTSGNAATVFSRSNEYEYHYRPVVVDWDADGKKDLLFGSKFGVSTWVTGGVFFCPNTGTDEDPIFHGSSCTRLTTFTGSYVAQTSSSYAAVSPEVVDWGADGDLDLLVGTGYWASEKAVRLYENTAGSGSLPVLADPVDVVSKAATPGLIHENYFEPAVVDIDEDGDWDLLIGGSRHSTFTDHFVLRECLNTGTNAAPVFATCGNDLIPGLIHNAIDFADWNGDGAIDLIRGFHSAWIPHPMTLFSAAGPDEDGDGLGDSLDNCPSVPNPPVMMLDGSNPVQLDTHGDGFGDACDDDLDGDGVANTSDNCVWTHNPAQQNADGDSRGAACDPKDSEPGYGSYEWEQANKMNWGRTPVMLLRVDALSQSFRHDIATSLIETSLAKDVPITIAVIPWNEDIYAGTDSAAWLRTHAGNPDLEIAQHGTYHSCKLVDASGPEFECGMVDGQSFNLMRVGYDSLVASVPALLPPDTMSHPFDGFIPPEDGFDADALEAARALGYRYLASSTWKLTIEDIEPFEPDATGLVHVPWTQAACGNESAPWLRTYCNPFDGTIFPDTKPDGLVARVSDELDADGISSIIFEVASYDLPSLIEGDSSGWTTTYTYAPDGAAIADFGELLDQLKGLTADGAAVFMTLGEYAAAKSITDDTPPIITITEPDGTYTAGAPGVPIAFTVTDDLSGVWGESVLATIDADPVMEVANGDTIQLSTAGTYTLTVEAEDTAMNSATASVQFEVTGRETALSYTGDITGQYSDYVSLSATLTDVESDPAVPVEGRAVTFALGTQSVTATTDIFGVAATTLALSQPAGTYSVTASFAGDETYLASSDSAEFEIVAEDAVAEFDDGNPAAVEVTEPESDASLPFSLAVHLTEDDGLLENSTGSSDLGLGDWRIVLEAVGPGSNGMPTSCVQTGTAAALTLTCDFGGLPVNTYAVVVQDDAGYYRVHVEDVLVVYDPSLGFATGGGWFYWPDTDDEKTNFGFTMKYNKKGTKVQGSLLLIRHTDEGIFRVKSNALFGLALGTGDDMGWASFSGKATYKEPGWDDAIGNHEFTVYVEDQDDPGTDRFWVQVRDKDGNLLVELSLPAPGSNNAEDIEGGNIVVPHAPGKKGGPKG